MTVSSRKCINKPTRLKNLGIGISEVGGSAGKALDCPRDPPLDNNVMVATTELSTSHHASVQYQMMSWKLGQLKQRFYLHNPAYYNSSRLIRQDADILRTVSDILYI